MVLYQGEPNQNFFIILYQPEPLLLVHFFAFRFENESRRERTLKILSRRTKDGTKRGKWTFFLKVSVLGGKRTVYQEVDGPSKSGRPKRLKRKVNWVKLSP